MRSVNKEILITLQRFCSQKPAKSSKKSINGFQDLKKKKALTPEKHTFLFQIFVKIKFWSTHKKIISFLSLENHIFIDMLMDPSFKSQ